METITFETEDGERIELSILDETKINGVEYILVTEDADAEEVEVMILKSESDDDAEVKDFVTVDDDDELQIVGKVFEEQLSEEDVEFEF